MFVSAKMRPAAQSPVQYAMRRYSSGAYPATAAAPRVPPLQHLNVDLTTGQDKAGVPPSPSSSPFLHSAFNTAVSSVDELFAATSPGAGTDEWKDGLRRSATLWAQRSPVPQEEAQASASAVWGGLGGMEHQRHDPGRRATTGNIFQYPAFDAAAAAPIFTPGATAHVPTKSRSPPRARAAEARLTAPTIRVDSPAGSPRSSPKASPRANRRESAPAATATANVPAPSSNPEFAKRCRYLFIDNGNVFVGAQSTADGSMDLAVRVNVKELGDLLEENYPCISREVAASRPSNPRICSAWQKVGYAVHTDSHGRNGHSARQSLALQVSQTVLDPRLEGQPQTLVLATGDGSHFPQLADLALRQGWNVIIWSWNRCLSDKFRKLRMEYPDLLELRLLDQFRDRITFRAAERGREPPASINDEGLYPRRQ